MGKEVHYLVFVFRVVTSKSNNAMNHFKQAITLFTFLFSTNHLIAQAGMEDLSKPGPEHKNLSTYVGSWNTRLQMGKDTYVGNSTTKMIVGNRFLQVNFSVSNETNSIEGIFMIGFDRRNNAYQVLGMDSFGTYFVTAAGPKSEEYTAKTYGKDDDPVMKKMGFEKEFGTT